MKDRKEVLNKLLKIHEQIESDLDAEMERKCDEFIGGMRRTKDPVLLLSMRMIYFRAWKDAIQSHNAISNQRAEDLKEILS